MSYSRNPKALLYVKEQLDQMIASPDAEITWITNDPTLLSYNIRQAFWIANLYKTLYPEFVGLGRKYLVKVGRDRVSVKPRSPKIKDTLISINTFKESVDKFISREVDVFSMVGVLIVNTYEEVYFPDANLSEPDLIKLFGWTRLNGYKIVRGSGITVTKKDCGDLEWVPTIN